MRHRPQPRRYADHKAMSALHLPDPHAPDLSDHEKHVLAVLTDKPSGFPVFVFSKARAA